MLRNYIKIALRNFKRNKVYSFINIACLVLGMMCTILILLWFRDELSYDKFHKNINNIYRINSVLHKTNIVVEGHQTPSPSAPLLQKTFPEISNFSRIMKWEFLVKHKSKAFNESSVVFAEPSFFEMFTFPLLKGDPKTALSNPNSIVISEDMVKKYSGDEEPVGRTFIIDNKHEFIVKCKEQKA